MSAYLVTGRGGSGKSAIASELQRRGYTAYDGDVVTGLSGWVDRATGKRVVVDEADFVDFSKVAWNWDAERLEKLLSKNEPFFLCGSASNQEEFHDRFDKVFVLIVEPETHAKRLQTRPGDYGKHPKLQQHIIDEHARFVEKLLADGAVAIDANQPLTEVVNEILRHAGYNPDLA